MRPSMRNPLLFTSVAAFLFAGPAHAQEGPAPGGDAGAPGMAAPMAGPEGADSAPSRSQMMPPGSDGRPIMKRPAEHDARERPQAREPSAGKRRNEDLADDARRRQSERGEGADRRDKADVDRPSARDAKPDTATNTTRDKGEDAQADESAATGRSEGTEDGAASSGTAADLTGEQRTKVQSSFRSHKSEAEVRDLDISINVGTVVPSTVTLYSVPAEVVVLLPAYRRYRYFIYEDTVVIVDPDTLAIVDVLVLA